MSILLLCITAVIGLSIFLTGEYIWRQRMLQEEYARKFVHIAIGLFAASWPLYLEWNDIRLISILLAVGYIAIRQLKLFKSVSSVKRKTYGEMFFALSFGLITLITDSTAIYMLAVLVMTLADGLAAVAGTTFGQDNSYKLFGGTKSVVGTATFFLVTITLIAVFGLYTSVVVPIGISLCVATIATVMENAGVQGLDNLFIPLFITLVYTAVS